LAKRQSILKLNVFYYLAQGFCNTRFRFDDPFKPMSSVFQSLLYQSPYCTICRHIPKPRRS